MMREMCLTWHSWRVGPQNIVWIINALIELSVRCLWQIVDTPHETGFVLGYSFYNVIVDNVFIIAKDFGRDTDQYYSIL